MGSVPVGPSAVERKNALTPAIVVLVGAALLVAALILPWYSFDLSGSSSNNGSLVMEADLDAFEICVSGSGANSGISVSTGQCALYMAVSPGTGILFFIPALLLVLSLILGLVAGALGFKASNDSGPVVRKKVRRPYALTRLSLVLLLVSIILFLIFDGIVGGFLANQLCAPGSSTSGWGGACDYTLNSSSGGSVSGTMTWGPSFGFFLAILSFVLLLVGAIRLRGYFRAMEPFDPAHAQLTAPPVVPPPAYPGY